MRGSSCTSRPSPCRSLPERLFQSVSVERRREPRHRLCSPSLLAGRPRSPPAELRRRPRTNGETLRPHRQLNRTGQIHAVSVVDAAEVQHDPISAWQHPGAPGRACGSALFGPDATIVSNAGRSKPARRSTASTSAAMSLSVTAPRHERAPRAPPRRSPARLLSVAISCSSLITRPASTTRSVGTSAGQAILLWSGVGAAAASAADKRLKRLTGIDAASMPIRRVPESRSTSASVSS